MRAKVEKHQWELGETQATTRREIFEEFRAEFERALFCIRSHLEKVRLELTPRFAGLDTRSIYNMWKKREAAMFKDVIADLGERISMTVEVRAAPQSNGFQAAAEAT